MRIRFTIFLVFIIAILVIVINGYLSISQDIKMNTHHPAWWAIMDIVEYGRKTDDKVFKAVIKKKHSATIDLGRFYFDLEVAAEPAYTPQLYLKDKAALQSYLDQHAIKDKSLSIFIKPNFWLNIQALPNYNYLLTSVGGHIALVLFLCILLWISGVVIYRLYATLKGVNNTLETLCVPVTKSVLAELFHGSYSLIHLLKNRIHDLMNTRVKILEAISHDLSSPLTRIQYRLESLDQTDETKSSLADLAETHQMINEILQRGVPHIQAHELIDLHTLTEVIVENYTEQGVVINYHSESSENLIVKGSATIFKRILYNLLNNSIKFADKIDVFLYQEAKMIHLVVADNGPGLPQAEDAQQLFQAGYQAKNQHQARVRAGFGLGLAIVYELVHQTQGNIVIENNMPRGLKVSIMWPEI